MNTTRRARLSQLIASGTTVAVLREATAAVSVIRLSLLPFSPRQREIAEQCRNDQERDHRYGDGGAFAQVAGRDAALEGERCQQMRPVHRPAAGYRVDKLEVREREDDRERHHDRENRQQQRKRDEAEALP